VFGTLTLLGVQEGGIFTDEHGRQFHVSNVWVMIPKQQRKYAQLIPHRDGKRWLIIRKLIID
jgi:hypothetical protein